MSRSKSQLRRASDKELEWIFFKLTNALMTRNLVFSIEKILEWKVLLHVKCDGELFSVYLRFDGKFEKPATLDFESFIFQTSNEIESSPTVN